MCRQIGWRSRYDFGQWGRTLQEVLDKVVDGERMVWHPVIAKLIAMTIAITAAHHKRGNDDKHASCYLWFD